MISKLIFLRFWSFLEFWALDPRSLVQSRISPNGHIHRRDTIQRNVTIRFLKKNFPANLLWRLNSISVRSSVRTYSVGGSREEQGEGGEERGGEGVRLEFQVRSMISGCDEESRSYIRYGRSTFVKPDARDT